MANWLKPNLLRYKIHFVCLELAILPDFDGKVGFISSSWKNTAIIQRLHVQENILAIKQALDLVARDKAPLLSSLNNLTEPA